MRQAGNPQTAGLIKKCFDEQILIQSEDIGATCLTKPSKKLAARGKG
jgi:hypothetical protein